MDILIEIGKFGLVFFGVLVVLRCLKVTIFEMAEKEQGIAWFFIVMYTGVSITLFSSSIKLCKKS